jgi:hypothetical protein
MAPIEQSQFGKQRVGSKGQALDMSRNDLDP